MAHYGAAIDDRQRSPIIAMVDLRRRELGWTQAKLAFACNTTQSHISQVLGGRSEPTLLVLEKMCAAVGLRLAAVYIGERPYG